MSAFVNTIEVLGDDAVIDSIIQNTITEFKDNIVTLVGSYVFHRCTKLKMVDMPSVTLIKQNAFAECWSLTAVILRSSTLVSLENTNAFNKAYHFLGTVSEDYNPDGLTDGYIYVPAALVDSYKAATNWSTYADQIRAIEDYPDITGG